MDSRPSKDFTVITQAGLKAYDLAVELRAAIEPRLVPGRIGYLADDLTSLGVLVPGAKTKRAQSVTATATQDQALAEGFARVSAIRENVVRRKAPVEVRKGYGVGLKCSPTVVNHVKSAITLITERAKADPAEAAALGILPKDVTELEAVHAKITSADTAQEQSRARAPLTTKARNQAANRILAALNEVIGAGIVEFATDPGMRKRFEDLASSSSPKPKKKTGA